MNKLPEPYRSRVIHNTALHARLCPEYFAEVMKLMQSRIAVDGLEWLPEHTHYFFNEPPDDWVTRNRASNTTNPL